MSCSREKIYPYMNRLISDFIDYIRTEKGLSLNTIEAYHRDIQLFAKDLSIQNWKSLSKEHILHFLDCLKQKQFAPSSICRMLIAVKVFIRFLKKEGEIP